MSAHRKLLKSTCFRLKDELIDVKSRWESHLSEVAHGTINKDVELDSLRESEQKIKSELMQRKEDIKRFVP